MVTQNSDIFVGCLIAALIAAVCAADSTKTGRMVDVEASSRVINGDIITIDQAPFMIQLKHRNKYFCGGALISTQHVLTAAHCFKKKPLASITAIGGASLITDKGVVRHIAQVFIHPKYTIETQDFDVAVLKLTKPFVEGNHIQAKTELCSAPPDIGEYIKVTGWGSMRIAYNGSYLHKDDYSKELRLARMPIISDDECHQKLKVHAKKLTKRMICAYDGYHSTFIGDSGSPGVYGKQLCTIVSWGIGNNHSRILPAMYTSVAAVRDFIEEKLKLQ